MASRVGKVCDSCPDETVIGTCAHPIMVAIVGHYEAGVVLPSARLHKFAWDIYLKYNEEDDDLDLQPLPRAERCVDCWNKDLTAPGALDVLTREEFLIVERVARGIPPEGRPEPEPEPTEESTGEVSE